MESSLTLSPDCWEALCQQINLELKAFYAYRYFSSYFNRSDIALKNLSKYFLKNSDEELSHAQFLIDYINNRRGAVSFFPITIDVAFIDEISTYNIFKYTLELEEQVSRNLEGCHRIAEEHGDSQLQDTLEKMMEEQVTAIKEASDNLTNVLRCTKPFDIFMFDKEFK